MEINWFPGHMTKSLRMMEENIKLVDCIIYVLDARAVQSCINPSLDKLTVGKPIIYVVNKIDLAEMAVTDQWVSKLSGEKTRAIKLNALTPKSANAVAVLAKHLCGDKLVKYANKGVRTSIRSMVIGVPNCGKSTLINNLCGLYKAVTGNRAGVTRGKQWVRVNDYFEVLDTPGTLYPKLSNQTIARHLAYIGSVKDEVVDSYELACSMISELADSHLSQLMARYPKIEVGDATLMLEAVSRSRGFVTKGGEADLERGATALIDDFRKGRLGRISLDRV